MSSPDDDLDALRRLASDRREEAAGAKKPAPRASGAAKPNAEIEDLASILAGRASVSSAQSSHRAETATKAPAAGESLEQLLRTGSAAQPRAAANPAATATAEFEGIEALAHPGSAVRSRPVVQPTSTVQQAQRVAPADALADELADVAHAAPESGAASRFGFNIPLPGKQVVIAVLLLLGIAMAVYQHQPGKVSYPSPIAATVAQLAASVDAYYAKQGSLPATLTQLETFPSDAVQWPMENYGLYLMDRRTEFFFGGDSGYDYVVIGRVGEEAWAFAKGMKPELQQVPAH